VIPVKKSGDAELTRDWLQTGFLRLKTGGQLWTAVDHPRDHWLHEEMKKLFPKVTRLPHNKKGVVYVATKTSEPKKIKNFRAEFSFRDTRSVKNQTSEGGSESPVSRDAEAQRSGALAPTENSPTGARDKTGLIYGVTRPGVFSHRRVDGGARGLIHVMDIPPGARVADIGCGSGTVGFAAALRHPDVTVLAIDSNPRAIECTRQGAELNGLTTITTLLNADALCEPRGTYDVVVGNPPYYSNYRIAEIFLAGARRALKPGGRVWMVTKQPHWFVERMSQMFDDVEEIASKGFKVIVGTQRDSSS
jgi:16S rRNA (guanine1207-N2)-methyltransferase